MPDFAEQTNWTKVAFGDVVNHIKDHVRDVANCGLTEYIRGEHFEPRNLSLIGRSTLGDGKHGSAFCMRFQPGDVMYVSRNPQLRKVAVADFEGICANTTYVCRANEKYLLQKLLPFIMQTESFVEYTIRHKRGSTNFYLNWSDIAGYEFALPPLKEQRRIVELLQAAEEAKRTLRSLKNQVELQRDPFANEVIWRGVPPIGRGLLPEDWPTPSSWKLGRVGDVVKFRGGSQPPKSTFAYEATPGYVRLLQIRDYKSDENLTFIPEDKASKRCTDEDIMIGRYGPPLFQILRGLEGAYNVALIKAEPDESAVDKEYLYHFLRQSRLHDLIDHMSTRSAGQAGIEMDVLKDYPIPLPPLSVQAEIAQRFDTFDLLSDSIDHRNASMAGISQCISSGLDGGMAT